MVQKRKGGTDERSCDVDSGFYHWIPFDSGGEHYRFGNGRLAVYNDAKSKMSLNAVMWAMLVGILGWIPGIVYLCVRNKPLERIYACYSCGWGNPLSARQCRRCGAGLYYPTEETARLQKKAKAF